MLLQVNSKEVLIRMENNLNHLMTTVTTAVEAMGEADEDGDSSPLLEDPGGWLRSPLEEPRSPHSSRSCRGRRVTGGAPGLEPSSLDITAMS